MLCLSQFLSNLLSFPQISNGIVLIDKEGVSNGITRIVHILNCVMKYCWLATYFPLVQSV